MPECLPSSSADFGTVNFPIPAEAVGLQRFHSWMRVSSLIPDTLIIEVSEYKNEVSQTLEMAH